MNHYIDRQGKVHLDHRVIGHIKDKHFVTHRTPDHYFVKMGGFGVTVSALRDVIDAGVLIVRIEYKGPRGKARYEVPALDLWGEPTIQPDGWDAQKIVYVPPSERGSLENDYRVGGTHGYPR